MLVSTPRSTAQIIFKHLRDPQYSKTFYSRVLAGGESTTVSGASVSVSTVASASSGNTLLHSLDPGVAYRSHGRVHGIVGNYDNSNSASTSVNPNVNNTFSNPHSWSPPTPPASKSKYQQRVTRHAMESKYLTNLINYKPRFFQNQTKFSVWHKVPVVRRSAVMVLLFLGNEGELRVILTKRSRKLKSFSGHVSLPGGKAENGLESEFQCARREMDEEIGLSRHNNILKREYGFVLDELKTMPAYLARTFLAVAPCVGYINWCENVKQTERRIKNLVLNPGESASVFSVPLRDFLQPWTDNTQLRECLKQSHIRTKWAGLPWNLRSFIFPVYNENETEWLKEVEDLSSPSEDETHEDQELDVRTRNCWGLTANILHDIAEVIYHGTDSIVGEEDLIWSLHNHGQIHTKERTDFEKRLINNTKGSMFSEVIPHEEISYLKQLYK